MSNPTLKDIHEMYYGPQDKYTTEVVANFNVPRHDGVVKETRTFTFKSCPEGKRFKHTMSHPYEYKGKDGNESYAQYKDEAYTNFKITPSSAISCIELNIGGQRIGHPWLYRFINKDVEFYEMTGGRAIPALAWHSNDILFNTDCECEVTMSYDVVTQVHKENSEEHTEIMLHCEQYCGPETITDVKQPGVSKVKLNYNHPIISLYAFLPDTTIDARVILDSNDYGLKLNKTDMGYYYIEFGDETTINFSRVDHPELQITLSETPYKYEDVSVIGINKHLLRRMNGMAGLAFSK
jgi:hypothetical protein